MNKEKILIMNCLGSKLIYRDLQYRELQLELYNELYTELYNSLYNSLFDTLYKKIYDELYEKMSIKILEISNDKLDQFINIE